jgi:TrmH family RNA methyltransferase
VQITYLNISDFLKSVEIPIYGAFMDGVSVNKINFPKKGILLLGNEANGISDDISQVITEKITIHQFGEISTESLNVATATAILLHEIRR